MHRRISIRTLPIGDRDTASSRIRCFRLMEFLPDGFDVRPLVEVLEDGDTDFDVLYVQKAAYPYVVEMCRNALELGIKVLYDIDDPFGLYHGMSEEEMCAVATAVTVDTEERAAVVREVAAGPVHVVPDALDYLDEPRRNGRVPPRPKSLVTFGNVESLSATSPFMGEVPAPYQKAYIGRPAGQIDDCEYVEWNLDTFIDELARFDLALLVHADDDAGKAKSNNRLLVAMSAGVPTLVSDTAAYAETVREVGFGFLVCRGPEDVPRALRELEDPALRQEIVDTCRDYVWSRYDPRFVSGEFARIVQEL